jgi:transposase
MKKYHVRLSKEGRKKLRSFVRKGEMSARQFNRAHVLLMSDKGMRDEDIAHALSIGKRTVESTRKKYCEGGLEEALYEKGGRGKGPKLNPREEAELIAIACSEAPEGRVRWTMELLSQEMKNRGVNIGREAIRVRLKKTK